MASSRRPCLQVIVCGRREANGLAGSRLGDTRERRYAGANNSVHRSGPSPGRDRRHRRVVVGRRVQSSSAFSIGSWRRSQPAASST